MTQPHTQDVAEIAAGLSEGERDRLIYGRRDWRDDRLQDHCGDWSCEQCTGLIPDPEPRHLSAADSQLRAYLLSQSDGGERG